MTTQYYMIGVNGYPIISPIALNGFTEYTVGQEPQDLKYSLSLQAKEDAVSHFKELYLKVVNDKLKALDYDSLATVKLWEQDVTFGAEAARILTWYKAIIALNYSILDDVSNGSRTLPTDAEYLAEINGVIF